MSRIFANRLQSTEYSSVPSSGTISVKAIELDLFDEI